VDKALNYLSLARKGGMAELGEEPVDDVSRAGKAYLIAVASDASDHTWRRAKSFAAGTEQQCLRMPWTKDEMGMAVGRSSLAIAAITDPSLAQALLKSLPESPAAAAALEVIGRKAVRQEKHRKEAKAHLRNVRKGKK